MEYHGKEAGSPLSQGSESRSSEPVRSRWTPKPEQIVILESIFNSGMVNPPKDETVRIRKLLQKFGPVGDANVFYWFQNRRSRSRRRQRQIQASLQQRNQDQQVVLGSGAIHCDSPHATDMIGSSQCFVGSSSSSSCGTSGDHDDVFSGQMGLSDFEQSLAATPILSSAEGSNFHFNSGYIVVFINGNPIEVPKGSLHVKAMFGQDAVLFHSSGVPVPTNEFGFLVQSLQPGESYFLVSRPT